MNDLVILAGKVNLQGGWAKVWNSISSAVPGLTGLMTSIGVILVAYAIGKWIWDKRKGGGGNSSGVFWTIVVGALFAAPAVVIPILLKFADWIANTVIGLVG